MTNFSSIIEVMEAAKSGRPFIILDNEREHEGDLMVLAEYITAETVNFMIKHCRGILCLAIDCEIAEKFELKMQEKRHSDLKDCASTMSIDARYGILSGTSAQDRAETIRVVASQKSTADDIKTPGHIFPVVAHNSGILGRAGHTESAVCIAKLCGAVPVVALCEILQDDGTMANENGLFEFATMYGLKISTISQLVKFLGNKTKFLW